MVGWEIFSQLTRAGIEAGYVNVDQPGMCYPEPLSDPGGIGQSAQPRCGGGEGSVGGRPVRYRRCPVLGAGRCRQGDLVPMTVPGRDTGPGPRHNRCSALGSSAAASRRRAPERRALFQR